MVQVYNTSLKEQCHEIFTIIFFLVKLTYLDPWSIFKNGFDFVENFESKIIIFYFLPDIENF